MTITRKKKEVLMIQVVIQEKKRDILTALEADEEIANLEEEELTIIAEITEVFYKEDGKISSQLLEIYQ